MASYSGIYFDGDTAKKHAVTVELRIDTLSIKGPHGEPNIDWLFLDVRATRPIQSGWAIELCCANPDGQLLDPRLTVDDPAFAEALLDQAPHLKRRRGFTRQWWEHPWAVAATMLVFVALVVLSVPRLAGPLAQVVPDEWRVAMGKSVEGTFLSVGGQCTSTVGDRALAKLVETLSQGTADLGPINVTVVNHPMVNAFALPGGRIVIMGNLLKAMETPTEFAGILAHEMGHAAERHPTEAVIRAAGFSIFLTTMVGDSSMIAEFLASLGIQAAQSSYTRDDERTADEIAIELLKTVGADPGVLARTFEHLKEADDKTGAPDLGRFGALFSTHPSYAERIETARQHAQPATRTLLSDTEWQALKSICANAAPKKPSGFGDEVGEQSVHVGGFFKVHHVTGTGEDMAIALIDRRRVGDWNDLIFGAPDGLDGRF
jgi:beta-barrel assembly-enhancing protease